MEARPIFKTAFQKEREKRDRAIYDEYNQLVSVEGQPKTVVTEYLMSKYKIHSAGTIYVIRRRVQEQIEAEQEASHEND